MKAPLILTSLACLALVSCGKSDGPKSKEEVAAAVEGVVKMKPGKYATTVTMTKMDIPGMPPQAAAGMKAAMAKPQTSEFCLTPEQSENGFKDMYKNMNKGDCTYNKFDTSGGSIDADVSCKTPGGGTSNAKIMGKMTDQGSDVSMDVAVTNPQMPGGGKMTMSSTMVSKRVGDCAA
jgi:Protein of unknown function (DUF3617)